ncbi:MAG: ABC transporter ATP-binding protein [Elusimicrobia bacterium]|nr:ABC transporter ATP-binding protein [Elusimicrobiota bacterium]
MGEAVTPALSFEHVTKRYVYSHLGRDTVTRGIEDLDLAIAQGGALGLLGLNGSGKTTTMKLALGLLTPTSGAVRVFGAAAGTPETHRAMGYLPELPYFYPFLTPTETLDLFGRLSGLSAAELAERVPAALAQVGLAQARERRLSQFSKGMLQRVGMAQAILHDPRLLLLDEPVSGLDPLAISEFRALLVALRERGKALLVSSHSISEVERVCDRAAILVEGRLVRIVEQADWAGSAGRLEELFVETVRSHGAPA